MEVQIEYTHQWAKIKRDIGKSASQVEYLYFVELDMIQAVVDRWRAYETSAIRCKQEVKRQKNRIRAAKCKHEVNAMIWKYQQIIIMKTLLKA